MVPPYFQGAEFTFGPNLPHVHSFRSMGAGCIAAQGGFIRFLLPFVLVHGLVVITGMVLLVPSSTWTPALWLVAYYPAAVFSWNQLSLNTRGCMASVPIHGDSDSEAPTAEGAVFTTISTPMCTRGGGWCPSPKPNPQYNKKCFAKGWGSANGHSG